MARGGMAKGGTMEGRCSIEHKKNLSVRPKQGAWRPWPRVPGLEVLAWRPWPGGPGLEALAWKPWPGGPSLEGGGPGLEALAWRLLARRSVLGLVDQGRRPQRNNVL